MFYGALLLLPLVSVHLYHSSSHERKANSTFSTVYALNVDTFNVKEHRFKTLSSYNNNKQSPSLSQGSLVLLQSTIVRQKRNQTLVMTPVTLHVREILCDTRGKLTDQSTDAPHSSLMSPNRKLSHFFLLEKLSFYLQPQTMQNGRSVVQDPMCCSLL